MITTAHAHKSGVIFHFFPRPFKQKKIKALRPKMTKIASRGGPALTSGWGMPAVGSFRKRTFRYAARVFSFFLRRRRYCSRFRRLPQTWEGGGKWLFCHLKTNPFLCVSGAVPLMTLLQVIFINPNTSLHSVVFLSTFRPGQTALPSSG